MMTHALGIIEIQRTTKYSTFRLININLHLMIAYFTLLWTEHKRVEINSVYI